MNGAVFFNTTNFGSHATYECNEGFELNGRGFRVCQLNKQWSGSEPMCEGELLSAVGYA